MTVLELLTEVFQDLGVLAAGETPGTTDQELGLNKLTRLLDNWNAERAGVYANSLDVYTLVPGLNPHTIGPDTATFSVDQRPVSIDAASLVLTDDVRIQLNIRDAQWWAALELPELSTNIPSDLHYEPTWQNGSIYLYPVPAAAYGLQLLTRVVLAALAIDDTLTVPPGYHDAISLTLGEMIAPAYPPATPDPEAAAKSRARIFANNDSIPVLRTADSGLPRNGGRVGTWFDWRSGLWRP